VVITWQVVAGDGVGSVIASLDPAGGQNFPAPPNLVQTIGTAPAVGTYNFTLNVTAVTCTGAGGVCTLQVKSSSDWYSCATVQLTAAPAPTIAPPTPVCQLVNGLAFCSELNGQYVTLPGTGATPVNLDIQTQNTYNLNYNNPMVFMNNSTACATAYKTFLCHNDFPYCGYKAACQSLCTTAIQTCQVTPAEAGLYNCNSGPVSCTYPGPPGSTGAAVSLRIFVELIIIGLLVVMF